MSANDAPVGAAGAQLAQELRTEVRDSGARLRGITEQKATAVRDAGTWTRKQILGHLIDSAANNHQRFVRAQFDDPFVGSGYDQDGWVDANAYAQRDWMELVDLWSALNGHLAHVMAGVAPAKLQTRCIIGDGSPVTLEWLMRDYLVHLRHHLAQILD